MKKKLRATAMFEPDLWFKIWRDTIRQGDDPNTATKYADICIEELKKRYGKKEETK